jgi:2-polyprenyl-3-methyl-5-hydroxy-6-metoxy-1,4-benzoquinol methylase
MAEAVDYFSNHRLKMRFPWALYHRPIVEALRSTLLENPGRKVLNLGSGPFFELTELGSIDKDFTLADIDPRAIELAKEIHAGKIREATVLDPTQPLPFADGQFDIVVSMDVIEHVPEPEAWLRDATRVLRPGGVMFLTTPNYASWSLKFLESTALEVIARIQGFSRANLHPSKMTPSRIRSLLESSNCSDVNVQRLAFGWVLAASARRV